LRIPSVKYIIFNEDSNRQLLLTFPTRRSSDLAGNSDNKIINLLSRPGLWLQNLTTKEPDRSMIQVAICAVEAVFDWKTYLNSERSEEHTSELQSRFDLVCRLLLEKKKNKSNQY